MPTVKHTLIAAKELLLEKGWCQKIGTNAQGQHCIVGALDVVVPKAPGFYPAYDYLRSVLGSNNLISWNDEPERTFDDVINLLDKAIANADTSAQETT